MGSICYINSDPNSWLSIETNLYLKPQYGGEGLYSVHFGTFDDDSCGVIDMEMYMRESVYLKVMSGEYTVSPQSGRNHELILQDKQSNIIPALKPGFCY